MELSVSQIRDCTRGVDRVEECDGLVVLHRFTREQEEMYRVTNTSHYIRTHATANVVMEFDTDSAVLELELSLITGSGRKLYNHSIFADGVRVGEISGTLGREEALVSGRFSLGEGEKRVKIYFPWSVGSRIRSIRLEDGASFCPAARPVKKMLLFGDSITQGYTALRPENTYAVRLAEKLGYEGINKAIGGEVFRPALAELPDPFVPELITVAYGTNDWSKMDAETFQRNSRDFYLALRKNYPNTPIVVLAPLWRIVWDKITAVGAFPDVAKHLHSIAQEIGNARFVDCFPFLNQDLTAMSDAVHPNDKGFDYYIEGLIESGLLD